MQALIGRTVLAGRLHVERKKSLEDNLLPPALSPAELSIVIPVIVKPSASSIIIHISKLLFERIVCGHQGLQLVPQCQVLINGISRKGRFHVDPIESGKNSLMLTA